GADAKTMRGYIDETSGSGRMLEFAERLIGVRVGRTAAIFGGKRLPVAVLQRKPVLDIFFKVTFEPLEVFVSDRFIGRDKQVRRRPECIGNPNIERDEANKNDQGREYERRQQSHAAPAKIFTARPILERSTALQATAWFLAGEAVPAPKAPLPSRAH